MLSFFFFFLSPLTRSQVGSSGTKEGPSRRTPLPPMPAEPWEFTLGGTFLLTHPPVSSNLAPAEEKDKGQCVSTHPSPPESLGAEATPKPHCQEAATLGCYLCFWPIGVRLMFQGLLAWTWHSNHKSRWLLSGYKLEVPTVPSWVQLTLATVAHRTQRNLVFTWLPVYFYLEKTLESLLYSKEIQPVHPKGNQSWIFAGSTDTEAETPILWAPDAKNWLTRKDPDAGQDWR